MMNIKNKFIQMRENDKDFLLRYSLTLIMLAIYLYVIVFSINRYIENSKYLSDLKKNHKDYKVINVLNYEDGKKVTKEYLVIDFKKINKNSYEFISTDNGVKKEKKDCASGSFFQNKWYYFNKYGEKTIICGEITIKEGEKNEK